VSTVAIGEGADGTRLEEIARIGKGAFHSTQDFKAMPSILSQEALLLSGKPVEEREALPVWSDRSAEFFAARGRGGWHWARHVAIERLDDGNLQLGSAVAIQEP
jgi:hypothetical protein